ncbi:LysR family transcriptional regulator [Bordetella petrii]|uniref:LysR family transcriptional regulator n=1 Tax=Bordetella petrii TaxID=94624 RepID=UPI0004916852|nr:LysR family transcriptional regulator [Bordetella petrii]
MSLTLRCLQHFAVLAEEQHFSRAAQRLHLTQSALSRSIQSLEASMGLVLLDRDASGMALTQAGAMTLAYAQRILSEKAELQRHAQRMRGYESGHVNFGVGVFPAATFLSPLLTQVAQAHPGLTVHVDIESWQRLLEKLQEDKLDFVVAITHSLPPPAEFTVHPLPPQHGGLFVRPEHPLLALTARRLRSSLKDYRLATTLLPQRARIYLAELYRVQEPGELPIAFECDSIPILRDVAQHSDVVLFATSEAIAAELEQGSLVPLPLALPGMGALRYNVIHRARRTLSPAAERIIALVKSLLAGSKRLAS